MAYTAKIYLKDNHYEYREKGDLLMRSVQNGNLPEVEKALESGADVDYICSWLKGTPLHHAVYGKHEAIVAKLINSGADVNYVNGYSFSPLDSALFDTKYSLPIKEMLVKAGGREFLKNAILTNYSAKSKSALGSVIKAIELGEYEEMTMGMSHMSDQDKCTAITKAEEVSGFTISRIIDILKSDEDITYAIYPIENKFLGDFCDQFNIAEQ